MSILRKPNLTPLILLGVLDGTINKQHFRSIMNEFRGDRFLGKYGTFSNDDLKTHVIVRISYKRGSNRINSIKIFSRPYSTNIQQGIEIDVDKKRTYWKTIHAYDIVLSDYIIPKSIFSSDFDAVLKDKLESLNIDYGPRYKF